jgi:uncharacterized protein (TIGR03000 family)
MYSVVLMMALSSGATAPAGHGDGGCWGGSGCHGGWSCDGGCNGGGHFFGRHGCNGGGHFLGKHGRGHGCNGGCNGGGHFLGRHGCNGGGHFLGKHGRGHGCNGCNGGGCWGGHGCTGAGCWGGHACNGGGHACSGGGHACHGGHGCTGGGGAVVMPEAGGQMQKAPEQVPAPKPAEGKEEEAARPAPATIVVSLPLEAKLMIDEYVTTSTSATRVFTSPALERGKDFQYTLKAEIIRDGQSASTTRIVTVRAGQETRVEMQFPTTSVAQK